jgi:hypothetical protein
MSNWKAHQYRTDRGQGVKKTNVDGSLNKEWVKIHGDLNPSNRTSNTKNHKDEPTFRPNGAEWDDFAWTADDF